jgi:hypothetical protein
MLPEQIQQHGLMGSLFGALTGWPTQTPGPGQPQPTLPPAPNANIASLPPAPQLPPPQQQQQQQPPAPAQAPPFQPRFQVPPGSDTAGRGQQVIPGQTNPHMPGTLPDDGFPWLPTRQPIVLDCWPVTTGPNNGKFTTVMQWESYRPAQHDGRTFGMKSMSFGPYKFRSG